MADLTPGVTEKLMEQACRNAGENFEIFSGLFRNVDQGTINGWYDIFKDVKNYEELFVTIIAQTEGSCMISYTAYDPSLSEETGELKKNSGILYMGEENGKWRLDFAKENVDALKAAAEKIEGLPEGYVKAVKAGRYVSTQDQKNYMYLDPANFYKNAVTYEVKHIWLEEDGGIGFTVWAANGMEQSVQFQQTDISLTDSQFGTLYDASEASTLTLEPNTGTLLEYHADKKSLTIEANAVTEITGSVNWTFNFSN